MSVSYTRVNFRNRYVKNPRNYTETQNQDGTITHTPAPGEIYQEGTKFSEAAFNTLDRGIDDCAKAINSLEAALNDKVKYFAATIPTTGWTSQGGGAYYTRSLSVSGILATDTPDISIVQTGVWATDEAMRNAWASVTRIVAAANQLNITAYMVPTAEIPLQVRCIR